MYSENKIRQHTIYYLPGTGVVTDGALDNSSVNGPWTFTVPDGFLGDLMIDCVSGGGGGAGGGNIAAVAGANAISGGGGGGCLGIMGYQYMIFYPNEQITITCGAAGIGGAVGVAGGQGGTTSVIPVTGGLTSANGCTNRSCVANISLAGASVAQPGTALVYAGTAALGGSGHGGVGIGTAVGTPSNGVGAVAHISQYTFCTIYGVNGAPGGGTSNVNYGTGGAQASSASFTNTYLSFQFNGQLNQSNPSGLNAGSLKYGGGGVGASIPGSKGSTGGNGNTSASNATGYGGGGGGGGGNGAGGNGAPGYVRITYISTD